MIFSEQNKDLIEAMDKIFHECEPIVKNRKNDFLKSKYADLQEVYGTIKKKLKDSGLHVLQSPTGEFGLHTRITHKATGQYVEDTFTITPSNVNPQVAGAVITYQRRYAIVCMFSLIVEDDDDGNSTSKKVESQTDVHIINATKTLEELRKLWETNPDWHDKKEYKQAVSLQKDKLTQ